MKTVYPINVQDRISSEKLKIDYEGKPKVLLIDDEAEKGWKKYFAYLLCDLNKVYVDYLGTILKTIVRKKSLKIIKENKSR